MIWILVVAAAILALLVARSLKAKNRSQGSADTRRSPTLSSAPAASTSKRGRFNLEPLAADELSLSADISQQPDALSAKEAIIESAPVADLSDEPAPSPLVVFHAMAGQGSAYQGYDLLQAMLSINLRFGERKIFHRYDSNAITGRGNILFSVASINKPGTFDLPKMGEFSCDGLVFFLQLDLVSTPVESLLGMHEAASTLIEGLGGYLADERHTPLSEEVFKNHCDSAAYYKRISHLSGAVLADA